MSKLKRCPFCGEMLERKHIRKTKSRNGYDYYQHPCNECILAGVEDGFPLSVYSDEVDDWNKRAELSNPARSEGCGWVD